MALGACVCRCEFRIQLFLFFDLIPFLFFLFFDLIPFFFGSFVVLVFGLLEIFQMGRIRAACFFSVLSDFFIDSPRVFVVASACYVFFFNSVNRVFESVHDCRDGRA